MYFLMLYDFVFLLWTACNNFIIIHAPDACLENVKTAL